MIYTAKRHNALHYLTRRAYRAHQWAKIQPVSKIIAHFSQLAV